MMQFCVTTSAQASRQALFSPLVQWLILIYLHIIIGPREAAARECDHSGGQESAAGREPVRCVCRHPQAGCAGEGHGRGGGWLRVGGGVGVDVGVWVVMEVGEL